MIFWPCSSSGGGGTQFWNQATTTIENVGSVSGTNIETLKFQVHTPGGGNGLFQFLSADDAIAYLSMYTYGAGGCFLETLLGEIQAVTTYLRLMKDYDDTGSYFQMHPASGNGFIQFFGRGIGGGAPAVMFVPAAAQASATAQFTDSAQAAKAEVFPDGAIYGKSLSLGVDASFSTILLDLISDATVDRTQHLPDDSGVLLVSSAEATGAGSAALGANSPAVTNTAPETWLTVKLSDGSTGYIPVWK